MYFKLFERQNAQFLRCRSRSKCWNAQMLKWVVKMRATFLCLFPISYLQLESGPNLKLAGCQRYRRNVFVRHQEASLDLHLFWRKFCCVEEVWMRSRSKKEAWKETADKETWQNQGMNIWSGTGIFWNILTTGPNFQLLQPLSQALRFKLPSCL